MVAALASATCDASSVLGPAKVEDITLRFIGDSSLIVGGSLAPRVDVLVGGTAMTAPRLRYLSSDSTVVAVSAQGDSLVARRIGSAVITAILEGSMLPKHPPSVTQRIHVIVGGLSADRPQLTLTSLGDTATLGVTAVDVNGFPVEGLSVVWRSSDTTIATINARGRVTARGIGFASLFGIVGIDTVVTALKVEQQIARFTFNPSPVRLDALGAAAVILVAPLDRNDSLVTGKQLEWTIDDPTIASLDQSGGVVARRNGSTWARVSDGSKHDSVRVIVDQRAVLVVISAPAGLQIPAVGDSIQLVAVGFDRMSKDVTDSRPTWYSLDPVHAQVDAASGYVRGVSAGSARIVATQDGAEDTVVVQVTNIPVSLTVIPAEAAMWSVGDTLALQATARNSRGEIVGVTVAWYTNEVTVVRVTDQGRVVALAAGTARVIASASGLADTAVISVTNAPASIDIVPTTVSLSYLGDTLSPDIVVRNARGDLLSRDLVIWSSDAPAVATVSPSGRITAMGAGTTLVRAASGAVRDSVLVTVTNDPVSIVLSIARDTMSAVDQQLLVTSVVRNSSGAIMAGYTPAWTTSNGSVASVSASGLVTATGFGTASIIARAGTVADTAIIDVRNPTIIFVDNSSTVVPAFGTRSRPFARIADGMAIAGAFDTVYVRATGIPYAESVAIPRRIMLLGDSAAYVTNGRDPVRLPSISHDTGSAAITITGGLPVTVRYLTIHHAVDGVAVDARGTDVRLEHVHVNPGFAATVGSGISVSDAPGFAVIANSTIRAVRGFGIRSSNSAGLQVTDVTVADVSAAAGTSGAGIQIVRGSGAAVLRAQVRNTTGPQVQVDTVAGVTIANGNFAGRSQLVRLVGLTGSNTVSGNVFNLTRQPGEPLTLGSETDGRSGLEIRQSHHVTVNGNSFFETQTAQMDAIRLLNARGTTLGAATILANEFQGGRHHVRSLGSTWAMTGARSAWAQVPILSEGADTVSLSSDTLENAVGGNCISSIGGSSRLTITTSVLRSCTVGGMSIGGAAITVAGSGTSLTVTDAILSGANQTAIDFAGRDLLVRRTRMSGLGNRSVTSFASSAALSASASGSVEIVGNVISDYPGITGLLLADGAIRADSNRITRNGIGLRILGWSSTQIRGNDIFGNRSIGVRNDRTNRDLIAEDNWWGDARGPRRTGDATATGDTAWGRVDYTPYVGPPHNPGSVGAELYTVRGDGQVGPAFSALPLALTVRLVDADNRPVGGIGVTMQIVSGSGSLGGPTTRTITSDASGLVESQLSLGAPGQVVIVVTAAGVAPLTLTATAQ